MTRAQSRRSSRRRPGEPRSRRPRASLLTKLQVEPARQSSSRRGKPGPGVAAAVRPAGLGSHARFSSRSTWEQGPRCRWGGACRAGETGRQRRVPAAGGSLSAGPPQAAGGECCSGGCRCSPPGAGAGGSSRPARGRGWPGGGIRVAWKSLAGQPTRLPACPPADLPAGHPRWPWSGSRRSATACAFEAPPPPRSSPRPPTPPEDPAQGRRSPWLGLLRGPWGHRAHHGVLKVQAVELGAGSGQRDEGVGSHAVAIGKLEEGEARTGFTDQLQETESGRDPGEGGQAGVSKRERNQ